MGDWRPIIRQAWEMGDTVNRLWFPGFPVILSILHMSEVVKSSGRHR